MRHSAAVSAATILVILTIAASFASGLVQRPAKGSVVAKVNGAVTIKKNTKSVNRNGLVLPWYDEHNEVDEVVMKSVEAMVEEKENERRRRLNHRNPVNSNSNKGRKKNPSSRHWGSNKPKKGDEAPVGKERIFGGWNLNPHEFPWMVKIKVGMRRLSR